MPSVRGGVYLSKGRLAIVVAVWLGLTILLAILVGVLKRCPEASEVATTPAPPVPTSSPTPDPNKPWEFIRLPTSVLPRHYVIILNPNFYTEKDLDFTGTVEIEIEVLKPTKYILIHINNINITSYKLTKNATNEAISTDAPFEYTRNQFWVLPVSSNLLANGFYRLKLDYQGSLDGLNGFYRSSYFDPKTNTTRYIVSSKFEPVDARKAFPCFDEPQMKAQYTVHIIHKTTDGYYSLSNMPQTSSKVYKPGFNLTSFQRSVTMSTYLVCFVVCDFGYVEGRSSGNKLFRVFAPKHKQDQLNYALEVGIKVQNYFEDYFDMPYTLPKQDMIAIPNFASGAMEHWGLITYREAALLYNETKHSLIDKFYVNRVISHELAHMWFGNIVTMAWWDDLWLNEGFASFISYKGMKISEPSWDTDALARLYATRVAFEVDDVISSHPIIVAVNTPAELSEVFDTITYRKGQAVILMLEGFMGTEKFKVGIQKYMKDFEFKNAKTSQLWEVLKQQETNLPLSAIMDTWTLQMGFPVINVSNANPPLAIQNWFLLDPASRQNAPSSPYNYLWRVRLNYKSSGSPSSGTVWMNGTKSITIQNAIDFSNSNSWMLLNIGGEGFYRVNYPNDLWNRFGTLIKNGSLIATPIERAGLLDDVMYLARSGEVPYETAMTMLQILKTERSFPVWIRASTSLTFLLRTTSGLPLYGKMRKFVQQLTNDIYGQISFNETTDLHQALLRRTVVTLACTSGLPSCKTDMVRLFNGWKLGTTKVPLEIRRQILQYGLMEDDTQATWDMMWGLYQKSDSDAEMADIVNALASSGHPWLIQRLLSNAMDGTLIKEQEFFSVMNSVAGKPTGRLVYWTWFRDNWSALVRRFSLNSRGLGRMILYIAPQLNSEVQLNEMKEFFARYPNGGAGSRARKQAQSLVEANLRWIKTNEATLSGWLNKNVN